MPKQLRKKSVRKAKVSRKPRKRQSRKYAYQIPLLFLIAIGIGTLIATMMLDQRFYTRDGMIKNYDEETLANETYHREPSLLASMFAIREPTFNYSPDAVPEPELSYSEINFTAYPPRPIPAPMLDKQGTHHEPSIASYTLSPHSNPIPIFVYHGIRKTEAHESKAVKEYNVSPEILEDQIKHALEAGYTPLTMRELRDRFKNGTLPEKPVVFTFDDGWSSQYRYAFPILKKYNVPATFYVFTNALGSKNFLSWEQVIEMDAAGMEIGSHTITHPVLTKLGAEAAVREITESKRVLEARLGKPVESFAYPFGNYNKRIVEVVKEAGFENARSTIKSTRNALANQYLIKAMDAHDNLQEFASLIAS